MTDKIDVEKLAESEYQKALQPKTPPLKQFHSMLEHTLKLLPAIDEEFKASNDRIAQIKQELIHKEQRLNDQSVLYQDLKTEFAELMDKFDSAKAESLDRLERYEAENKANQELINMIAKKSKKSAAHELETARVYASRSFMLGCILTYPFRFWNSPLFLKF